MKRREKSFSLLQVCWIAACLIVGARAQVINPVPANPGPYGGPPWISFIEVQSDGKIVVAGDFFRNASLGSRQIVRLNVDGTLDDTFQQAALPTEPYWGGISALLALPEGKLLVGLGSSNGLVRLNADGSIDPTFRMEPLSGYSWWGGLGQVIRQKDGKIIISGSFIQVGTNLANGIARLEPDGELDPTFRPQLTVGGAAGGSIWAVAQGSGKIIVSGQFDAVDGMPYNGLARLHADGSVDRSFLDHPWPSIGLFGVQSDGKLLVRESTTVARLLPDGEPDYTWNPGLGVSGTNRWLMGAVPHKEGALLYGNFDAYDNQPRRALARVNADGSLDSTFDARLTKTSWASNPQIEVRSIKVLEDGAFFASGSFTGVQGEFRTGLVRITADGKVDKSFDPFRPRLREETITSDGFCRFRIEGEEGRPYVVESSDDLNTWHPLRNYLITRNPSYFVDMRKVPGQCFYRITSLE